MWETLFGRHHIWRPFTFHDDDVASIQKLLLVPITNEWTKQKMVAFANWNACEKHVQLIANIRLALSILCRSILCNPKIYLASSVAYQREHELSLNEHVNAVVWHFLLKHWHPKVLNTHLIHKCDYMKPEYIFIHYRWHTLLELTRLIVALRPLMLLVERSKFDELLQ